MCVVLLTTIVVPFENAASANGMGNHRVPAKRADKLPFEQMKAVRTMRARMRCEHLLNASKDILAHDWLMIILDTVIRSDIRFISDDDANSPERDWKAELLVNSECYSAKGIPCNNPVKDISHACCLFWNDGLLAHFDSISESAMPSKRFVTSQLAFVDVADAVARLV